MDKEHHDVIILGAGISGLSCAVELSRQKNPPDFILLDRDASPGGKIQTKVRDERIFEDGPNSLMLKKDAVKELIATLNLQDQLLYPPRSSQSRYLFRKGHLLKITPKSLFTELLDFRSICGLFLGGWSPRSSIGEESARDFFRRKFGPSLTENLVEPFISGIYAGNSQDLTIRSAFPRLYDWDRKFNSLIAGAILGQRKSGTPSPEARRIRSGMVSFKGGLGQLTNSMAKSIGGRFYPNSSVVSMTYRDAHWKLELQDGRILQCNRLVSSLPAYDLSTILPERDFGLLKSKLAGLKYPFMRVFHFFYKKGSSRFKERGFGFLTIPGERRKLLGCLFPSSMFTGRCQDSSEEIFTVFTGGSLNPDIEDISEDEHEIIVRRELEGALGLNPHALVKTHCRVWPDAIPQYNQNHLEFMDWIRDLNFQNQGLYLCGNYIGGISIPDCIEFSQNLAKTLSIKD